MDLSDKEQELYDFITNNENVTINQMQKQLSLAHVGALGKLLRQKLIVKDKCRMGEGFNVKIVTVYKKQ